jgi:hypothetical protein
MTKLAAGVPLLAIMNSHTRTGWNGGHSSTQTRVEAAKREPSARGYNWATLFLGDTNTGTWPSRLGESQMRL